MKEGKGVLFVFVIPICALSALFGMWVASVAQIPIVIPICLLVGTIVWCNVRPTVFLIACIVFLLALLRATIPISFFEDFENPFLAVRRFCDSALSEIFTEPARTLISGVIFGGTSRFTPEWKDIFRATGTSHIVAVSGANVVFVVQWAGFIFEKFKLSRGATALCNVFFISIYVLTTGAPASVVRAAIMVALAQYGLIRRRYVSALHTLAAAVVIMIFIDPKIAADIGFQFSCLATLGLIIVTGKPHADSIGENMHATIAATLFVLPLQLWYFKTISFVAILANTVVVPFIPILMMGGIISLIFTMIAGPIGKILAFPLQHIADLMLMILRFLGSLTGSVGELPVSSWILAVSYLGLFFYALYKYSKKVRFLLY